jgi:hypothetical protein
MNYDIWEGMKCWVCGTPLNEPVRHSIVRDDNRYVHDCCASAARIKERWLFKTHPVEVVSVEGCQP